MRTDIPMEGGVWDTSSRDTPSHRHCCQQWALSPSLKIRWGVHKLGVHSWQNRWGGTQIGVHSKSEPEGYTNRGTQLFWARGTFWGVLEGYKIGGYTRILERGTQIGVHSCFRARGTQNRGTGPPQAENFGVLGVQN